MRETVHVPARAALAGNPSDGYGGAVTAVPVWTLQVSTTATPAASGLPLDAGPGPELVAAAREVFADHLGDGRGDEIALSWRTTIPRSVGLAGSSAIVVAALRALLAATGTAADAATVAALALEAERDRLGVAAGPQDRVVQAVAAPVLMEFAEPGPAGVGRHRQLTTALGPELYVAWSAAGAAPSGDVHDALRRRVDADPATHEPLVAELAAAARAAAAALEAGDGPALDRWIDASFAARRAFGAVDAVTDALAGAARAAGASANSAGSGGAVVGRCPADAWPGLGAAIAATGGQLRRLALDPGAGSSDG